MFLLIFFLIFGNRNFLRVYVWHEAFRLGRKCHLLPTMHYFPTLFLCYPVVFIFDTFLHISSLCDRSSCALYKGWSTLFSSSGQRPVKLMLYPFVCPSVCPSTISCSSISYVIKYCRDLFMVYCCWPNANGRQSESHQTNLVIFASVWWNISTFS